MKNSVMRTLALALTLTLGGTVLANAANAPDIGKTGVASSAQVVPPGPTVAPTQAQTAAPASTRGWAASSASSKPISGPALAKRVGQGPQPQIVPFSIP